MSSRDDLFLVLIWKNALSQKPRILADLRERFQVLSVEEVRWSDRYFSSNLTRFYGTLLPDGSHKEEHCGRGPFYLIVIRDPSPQWAERRTSKGLVSVNAKLFDLKAEYRVWTGGGHRIHASLTDAETRHDLMLLTGRRLSDYTNRMPVDLDDPKILERDLPGASGWESLAELFRVLNETIRYVVLRNFETLPEVPSSAAHMDVDLLTDDRANLEYLLNGKKVFRGSQRVHYRAIIGGQRVSFDLRYAGDGYYDERWEKDLLDSRVLAKAGFYIPNAEHHFYSLLYHALIHKRAVEEDYLRRLGVLACEAGISASSDGIPIESLKFMLDKKLGRSGYQYVEPLDPSVYYNDRVAPRPLTLMRRWNEVRFSFKNRLRAVKRSLEGAVSV